MFSCIQHVTDNFTDSYDYKRSGGSRPWNWDWSVQKFILEGIPVLAHYERDFIELSLRGCPGGKWITSLWLI